MTDYKLAAFDFDHTIIDVNSDTFIDRILLRKNQDTTNKNYKYPNEIENFTKTHNWTHRMNAVFNYMDSKYSVTKQDLINCLHEIKIEDSMVDLLKTLHKNSFNLIIVSDANSIFIEEILKKNGLLELFTKIYTNQAEFNIERLQVQPFNELFNANKELFDCPTKICSTNICKGMVLTRHLEQNSNGSAQLVYVGDGHNDFCPGLYLGENDYYFVRNNHSLSRLLAQRRDLAEKIKSKIFNWTSGNDILKHFK